MMDLPEVLQKWCGICGEKKERFKYDWFYCTRCDRGNEETDESTDRPAR